MKKNLLAFALLALMISNVDYSSKPQQFELSAVEQNVTVYLNLTSIGLIDGSAGSVVEGKYIENGYTYQALANTALPDATRITSTTGAKFLHWVVPSENGLQAVDVMPSVNSLILQAWWEEITPPLADGEEPLPTGYAYLAVDGVSVDTYQLTKGFSTVLNTDEYSLLGVSLTKDLEFSIKTSADIFGINETSFPTYKTNFLENGTTRRVGYTLSASSTNLSADYLDVVNVPGESGTSTDGRWIKYFYPNDPGKLKVKSSGTYNIYISLFDDYSWARIYIEPAI
ncbi:MAG: hypothetical protein AB7D50_04350 [Bacilli bacterium]